MWRTLGLVFTSSSLPVRGNSDYVARFWCFAFHFAHRAFCAVAIPRRDDAYSLRRSLDITISISLIGSPEHGILTKGSYFQSAAGH